MLARKNQRQAAIRAAALAKNKGSSKEASSSKATKSSDSKDDTSIKRTGSLCAARLRRSRSQPRSQQEEGRDDGLSSILFGRSQSSSREQGASSPGSSLARPRSFRRSKSKEKLSSDDTVVTTSDSIFRLGDKRQKKVVYSSYSENPFDLKIEVEEAPPTPKYETDVTLKISASTVSYEDCMMRRGICFGVVNPIGVPATPGMDVVGIIVSVGEGVTSFNVGDRVAALVRTGGNARYINVPESDLVEVPKNCDAAEAVCMVSTFMTAYQSLRLVTNDTFILNDKRILITGGIEPVGQALIQLCFRAGAKEIYATAPNHRHRYVRTVLGARPLPVDPALWLETVKGTMDIVFDGTCYDTFESATASLNEDGTMISLGMSALLNREKPGVLGAPLTAYWAKLKSQIMSNSTSYEVWESFVSNKDAYKLDMEILFHLLKKKFIKPHICKRVALSEVAEAQDSLEKENARGDIVCLPWKRIGK